MATTTTAPQAGTLTGTPVVPGIAHGPVLLARTEVSPAAIDAFDGSALTEDDALARYDEVAGQVVRRVRRQGAARPPAQPPRC